MQNFFLDSINQIIKKFAQNQFLILIGFEFEFYIAFKNNFKTPIHPSDLINKNDFDLDDFLININQILLKNQFDGVIQKEVDDFQFEIISKPTPDPCSAFLKMQDALKEINSFVKKFFKNNNDLEILSLSKPFEAKPGNGLHFHLSVYKIPTMENIFLENHEFSRFLKNKFMAKIIGITLIEFKKQIKNFFKTDSMIKRIKNFDRNTPTCFAWGKNNRTVLLRIPESLPGSKRIEFRGFSSENDFFESLYFFLRSCEIAFFEFEDFLKSNSLNSQNFLPEPIFGLAYEPQYNLEKFIDYL